MERRKMFVAALLILIMVLQSLLPMIPVNALTTYDVEITSNSKLYNALKEELIEKNIDAVYDDANSKIYTSNSEIAKVTELDLSNAEIDDLTGLGNFTKVTSLNLTSNNLTVESNLSELDKLPLVNLNLSSNEIESVDSITSFDNISYRDITNQTIEKRDVITLDISEESDQPTKFTIELPDLLLEDGEEIKAEWLDVELSDGCNASVEWESFNPRTTTCTLIVANKTDTTYVPYKGLLTIKAKVEDSKSKIYNTNVTLYYAITDSEETGICFDDDKLYNAVKAQLTAGQLENEELKSYDIDGETLYSKAYDDAKILVISNDTLINEITSLILNDKQIKDLTGIEEFIGLDSELNVSYNYIETIDRILELEENKEEAEKELLAKYTAALKVLEENRADIIANEAELKRLEEQIESVHKAIDELDETAADYQSKVEPLLKQLNDTKTGLLAQKAKVEKNIAEKQGLISEGLMKLYSIYNNEYKLTTILPLVAYELSSEDMNDLTLEEAKKVSDEIMNKITKLESEKALTDFETTILIELFDIETTTEVEQEDAEGNKTTKTVDIENPIAEYFKVFKSYEEYKTIADYKVFIKTFKYVDILTTAMNYCLIERMNDSEITDCLFEDALAEIENTLLENGEDVTFLNIFKYVYEAYKANPNLGYGATTDYQIALDLMKVYKNLNCSGAYKYNYNLEKQVSGKLVNTTSEELAKFIVLPRIEVLNIEDNKIETIAGIENLDSLLKLYAFKNNLGSIDDVDWTKMTSLTHLDLGYNQLSNVDALVVLTNLKELKLTRNLLSGNFNFYLAGMKELELADFSYNQYSNIAYIVSQYTFIAKGQGYDNVGEFLVKSADAPVIRFQYQNLKIKATLIKEADTTKMDLPKIFAQAEELDYLRTSFGETSLNGNVLADGTAVVLNTPAEGDYKACVVVDGRNGNSYSYDGIAYGTTCNIEYSVLAENAELPVVPETPENPDNTETPENPDDSNTVETPENPDNTEPPANSGDTETPVTKVEFGYTVANDMVLVHTPEITVKSFKENLVSDEYTVTVINENREIVTDNTILRTGYMVSVDKAGENLVNLEVVVKGDVNGDGEVDALDTGLVRQVINDIEPLVGVYALAADVNSDGTIDSQDSLQILKYRAAKINMFEK